MLLVLLVFSANALKTEQATASANSTVPGDAVVSVTLGQSVLALNGPWKFHIGDDPRWADPDFDDSQWETVDLIPTPETIVRGVPISGFVTGWEARPRSRLVMSDQLGRR